MNQIYNEDIFQLLNRVNDGSVDLIIADPPYGIAIDKWDTFKSEKEYLEFTFKWIDKMLPKLKPNGSLYIFNTPKNNALTLSYLNNKNLILQNWIVWYKKDGLSGAKRRFVSNQETILFYSASNKHTFNFDEVRVPYISGSRIEAATKKGIIKNGKRWFPNPNGKLCTDIWEFSSHRHKNKINGKVVKQKHMTPKPEDLIERIIKASSNENDLVLDLFSGTGTTSYISKKLNRNSIGCDINKEYVEQI